MIKIIFILFFLSSCHFFHDPEVKFNEVHVEKVPSDFKVPKKIFTIIQDQVQKESKTYESVYIFTPLEVVLDAENSQVISNNPVKISFPNGGGKIDLKDHLIGPGSFYISFPPEQFKKLPELIHLYFVSDSPKKMIDDEIFGLGCGSFVDLKSSFSSLHKRHFLKLNTTDLRYTYVTTGYYIFVFQDKNKIYLTHVNIFDSRYLENMCSVINQK